MGVRVPPAAPMGATRMRMASASLATRLAVSAAAPRTSRASIRRLVTASATRTASAGPSGSAGAASSAASVQVARLGWGLSPRPARSRTSASRARISTAPLATPPMVVERSASRVEALPGYGLPCSSTSRRGYRLGEAAVSRPVRRACTSTPTRRASRATTAAQLAMDRAPAAASLALGLKSYTAASASRAAHQALRSTRPVRARDARWIAPSAACPEMQPTAPRA